MCRRRVKEDVEPEWMSKCDKHFHDNLRELMEFAREHADHIDVDKMILKHNCGCCFEWDLTQEEPTVVDHANSTCGLVIKIAAQADADSRQN